MNYTSTHADLFSKLFRQADERLRPSEVFDIFIDCAFLAQRQAVHVFQFGSQCHKIESQYLDRVKLIKNPPVLAEMLGHAVMSLTEKPHDFLGEVYMVNEFGNDHTGQFFTPYELSKLMTQMTAHGITKQDHRIKISDPCSGSGSTLVATVEHLRERGFDNMDFSIIAEDYDLRCCKMAYIQFTLLDIPAIVRHQNTLTAEVFGEWKTFALARTPFDRPMRTDQAKNTPETRREVEIQAQPEGQSEFKFLKIISKNKNKY